MIMKEHSNWRPPQSEVRQALSKYRKNQKAWVKCRIRILEEFMANPNASDSLLADNASSHLKTVEGLFQRWKVEGIDALIRFGRPPELMEQDRKTLERLIVSGKLQSPEDIQEWVGNRPRLAKKNVFTLDQARVIYDRTRRVKRVQPQYRIPAAFLADLKIAKPQVAAALQKVLDGASLRDAAGTGCESLLRYYLQQAAQPKRRRRTLGFRQAFFVWCDQQNKPDITFETVTKFLKSQRFKASSTRTIHRYLQQAKDYKGILRRHWTCGGSKHSGLAGL
jgi:hypothetical protein